MDHGTPEINPPIPG